MIAASCHCGALGWRTPEPPPWLTVCNCAYCRKIDALWGEAPLDRLQLIGRERARSYQFATRALTFLFCPTCGVVTHWESASSDPARAKLNFRLAEPAAISGVRVRHFDGARTGRYLD